MPKEVAPNTSIFDDIVSQQLRKSVVVAPSDPTGGAKLPRKQEDKAKAKGKQGDQYEAVFDRKAKESNGQLDEWMEETNEATESDEDFVNKDDDETWSGDPDNEGSDTHAPLSDEEGEDENVINVRGHKRRRVAKSNKAEADDRDGEDINLSDEDDDDLDEGGGVHQHKGGKTAEEKGEYETSKEEEEKKRRKEVKKALGIDNVKLMDHSPLVKALVDAVFDMRDESIAEVRALRSELRGMKKSLQVENREMVKSLTAGMVQLTAEPIISVSEGVSYGESDQHQSQPIRKSFGLPASTTQKFAAEFNLAKSLDVLDEAFQKGEIEMRDCTILENDRSPQNLSRKAIEALQKAKCL